MSITGKVCAWQGKSQCKGLEMARDWWVQGTAKRPEWLACHVGIIDHGVTWACILCQMEAPGGL